MLLKERVEESEHSGDILEINSTKFLITSTQKNNVFEKVNKFFNFPRNSSKVFCNDLFKNPLHFRKFKDYFIKRQGHDQYKDVL